MMQNLLNNLASISLVFSIGLASTPLAWAEPFSLVATAHDITLKVEQTYNTDGASAPRVEVNGAVLRQYSLMQRLSVAFDHKFPSGDRIVVVHHWQGGNGCNGALTLIELTRDGILQIGPVAECAENFSVELKSDNNRAVRITTYADEAKTMKNVEWIFDDEQLVKQ